MLRLPSRTVAGRIRSGLSVFACFVLTMPQEWVAGTPLVIYIVAWTFWWALALFWRMVAPQEFADHDRQIRRELGLAAWYRYEALRHVAPFLAFLVAYRFADVAVLWLALASVIALILLGLWVASLAATEETEARIALASEGEAARPPRSRRIAASSVGLLLLSLWAYAWRGLAA